MGVDALGLVAPSPAPAGPSAADAARSGSPPGVDEINCPAADIAPRRRGPTAPRRREAREALGLLSRRRDVHGGHVAPALAKNTLSRPSRSRARAPGSGASSESASPNTEGAVPRTYSSAAARTRGPTLRVVTPPSARRGDRQAAQIDVSSASFAGSIAARSDQAHGGLQLAVTLGSSDRRPG